MTISFYLKKEGGDHNKTIYVQFYSAPHRYTFATRYKVDKKDWAAGQPKKANTTSKLRADLIDFEKAANAFVNGIIDDHNRQPTKGELQMFMKKLKGQADLATEDGQIIAVDNKIFLKGLFEQYEAREFKNLKPATHDICNKTFALVNEFAPNAQIYDVTHIWGEKFIDFLLSKNMQKGTANKYVKKLTTVLNWCSKKQLINGNFTSYLVREKYVEPEIIVVDQEELHQLETSMHTDGHIVELSDRLERIRKLFVFACYIGQRFEDVIAVTKDNLLNDGVTIRVKQQKTGQIVNIPLLPEAQTILEFYNWELPQISNQKANEYLKDLFVALGLNRIIHGVRKQGQGEKLFDLPLSEVIHFHVARATFCTTALANGIPEKIVMQLSGHNSQKNFQRYLRFSNAQLAANFLNKMSRSARSLKVEKSA